MLIEITKQEAWKVLDAIQTYTKDYAVNGSVSKTLSSISKKLKKVVNE